MLQCWVVLGEIIYAAGAAKRPMPWVRCVDEILRHERIGREQTTYASQPESYGVRGLGKFPIDFAKFVSKPLSLSSRPW
jgi:hypothetical protein